MRWEPMELEGGVGRSEPGLAEPDEPDETETERALEFRAEAMGIGFE